MSLFYYINGVNFYSILIPIHNEKEVLEELLNKVHHYTNLGHEIIIIDDGSTDGTSQILSNVNHTKTVSLKKKYG